jgi:transcriptional regulator with PAS, ATPase and Fis domain
MCDNHIIEAKDITYNAEKSMGSILNQEMSFDDYTNSIINYYLEKYDHNVITVAKKLKIGKSTIYRIMKTDSFQKIYNK